MRGVLLSGALVGLLAGIAAGGPGLLPGPPAWWRGAGAGALVGTTGSLIGAWVVRRRRDADTRRFLAGLFGVMLGRLLLFGAVIVAVAMAGEPPLGAFLGGLIAAYLLLQAAEVGSLHRRPAGGDGRG